MAARNANGDGHPYLSVGFEPVKQTGVFASRSGDGGAEEGADAVRDE
jgi:hypothetical protein